MQHKRDLVNIKNWPIFLFKFQKAIYKKASNQMSIGNAKNTTHLILPSAGEILANLKINQIDQKHLLLYKISMFIDLKESYEFQNQMITKCVLNKKALRNACI